MKMFVLPLVSVCFCAGSFAAAAEKINPVYEKARGDRIINRIDLLTLKELKRKNIRPAALASDGVFMRRAYQDLTGSMPQWREAQRYIKDKAPDKRAKLIEKLMNTEKFREYWTLKWCDLLRVKSEFPINLWPNATQAYHRWIYNAVKDNMPYDKFARELLLSSGSNFRNPEANFYRAMAEKTPEGTARSVMLTFMGTRYDKWPNASKKDIAQFFSRIKYKSTDEWKEEIVYADLSSGKKISTRLPDGSKLEIPVDKDPREIFVKWLVSADNPWFARCAVNRIWYWLMGRGIIHEADDIMPDSVPANPQLLSYLESEFIKSGFDTRHMIKLIVNSDTYQQSFIPRSDSPEAAALFAFYPVRRLDAEVIIDWLDSQDGRGQKYVSPIPEPFTYVPDENRTIALADGSIGSQFLSCFGRPARDSGMLSERKNFSTDSQRLFMLNSEFVQQKLRRSSSLRDIVRKSEISRKQIIEQIYLMFLTRLPSHDDLEKIKKYPEENKTGWRRAVYDLSWALLNSKEFIYHH